MRIGNVLKVGLGRAEPAGGGPRLVEAGMNPPSPAVDPLREGVHIGALQLLELAVLQDEPGKLVSHGGKLLQHVGIGRGTGLGFLQHRQLVLLEQDAGQLAGRVDVQVGAGHSRDLLFQPAEVLAQLVAQPAEDRRGRW